MRGGRVGKRAPKPPPPPTQYSLCPGGPMPPSHSPSPDSELHGQSIKQLQAGAVHFVALTASGRLFLFDAVQLPVKCTEVTPQCARRARPPPEAGPASPSVIRGIACMAMTTLVLYRDGTVLTLEYPSLEPTVALRHPLACQVWCGGAGPGGPHRARGGDDGAAGEPTTAPHTFFGGGGGAQALQTPLAPPTPRLLSTGTTPRRSQPRDGNPPPLYKLRPCQQEGGAICGGASRRLAAP